MTRRIATLLLVIVLTACAGAPAAPLPTAATATIAPTVAPTAIATPTPPLPPALAAGATIDLGGRALFVQCVGPLGVGPTVLLESGLAGDSSSWDRVLPEVAQFAHVCRYDRAGLGRSDPAPTPRSAADIVVDLQALLERAAIPGPYLLVAHSFGGLPARLFADRNPDLVVGMVLVDAVHEDWWPSALAALPPPAAADSQRLQSFRRFLSTEVADPARNGEGLDIPASAEQVRAAQPLGARPLIVLTAGIPDVIAPGLPPSVHSQLVRLLQVELPSRLTALSSDSTQVAVPDSGHNIPTQRPAMVVLAVQAVLAAISNRP